MFWYAKGMSKEREKIAAKNIKIWNSLLSFDRFLEEQKCPMLTNFCILYFNPIWTRGGLPPPVRFFSVAPEVVMEGL